MSQSNKRKSSSGGGPAGRKEGASNRPASASGKASAQGRPAARGGSTRPPVKSAPVQDSSFRGTVNRALPPFSTQRYVAIWAAATLVLVAVLLVLIWPSGGNTSGGVISGAQPTGAAISPQADVAGGSPVSQGQTAQPTQIPVAGEATGTAPGGGSPAGGNAAGAGKFFVIDTDKGRIVARLHTDASANVARTIANFEQKANASYFDVSNFHRVEDWVVQGGDPTGTGTGGIQIPSEYNELPFVTGALGVARTVDRTQMNDSQFFIVKRDSFHLNGEYTNWGQVVEGMDVVNALATGDRMTKVRVENR